ncbi:family 2 encapsulin nanocompartment cargo protein terpene cyclase [Nocardia crassostreae]|uniref:family 2 encapsulin nanocompartment cargo protein terpene cyclase n=1 Tax=Nocardia crassostreae TaxID=53428 RepID=UPI000A9AFCC6|nr:family 2 encapsulin nanocompartment cargo protein terpene cyclase [Nocardia crassostreae]
MSVLSRAAAPPATHEVAAAVAELLKNFDPTVPVALTLPESVEAPAPLDDPRLGESDAAEVHTPKRLIGPSGLGAASLLVNLPSPADIAAAARAATPVVAANDAPRPSGPRTNGSGAATQGPPTRPESSRTAAPPAVGAETAGPPSRIVAAPSGFAAPTALLRGLRPVAPGAVEPSLGAGRAAPPAPPAAEAPAVGGTRAVGVPSSITATPEAASAADIAALATDPEEAVEAAAAVAQAVPTALAADPVRESPERRISPGPTGIGTASMRRRRAAGQAIPPLYCPPPVRDDPVLAEAVNEGIIAWAEEIGLYEGRLDDLRKADFGRLIMLAHPDSDDADQLLAVAKCAVTEWSVDDYYCEEDASDIAPDGSKSTAEAELGPRLELAAAAMDPVHLPVRYQVQVEEAMQNDPILRAFRTSFQHLSQFASPTQVARLRTEIAGWFIALGAEAGWRAAGRMPPVWEYLLNRQPHSFLPCMAPLDAVGGYELPAPEYTDPRVRRVVTTAALASQMVNDLYSMAREDLSNGREFNLPTVLAAEEQCSRREAVERTAEVHDELVHRFEAEAGALAATGSPELRRFLGRLWAWMGGNRAWHADSRRYND